MTSTVEFVGGDDLIVPVLIEKTDGTILDLTGYTISGIIFWRGKTRIALASGVEIDISTMLPGSVAVPHGYVRLTEEQTAEIPFGAVARLRLKAILSGVTLSTVDMKLDRVG